MSPQPTSLDPKQMPASGSSPPKAQGESLAGRRVIQGTKQPRNWELEGAEGRAVTLAARCPCVFRGSGVGPVWVPRQGPVSGLPTYNKVSSNHKTLSTARGSCCRDPAPGQALSGWADFVVTRIHASHRGSTQDRPNSVHHIRQRREREDSQTAGDRPPLLSFKNMPGGRAQSVRMWERGFFSSTFFFKTLLRGAHTELYLSSGIPFLTSVPPWFLP